VHADCRLFFIIAADDAADIAAFRRRFATIISMFSLPLPDISLFACHAYLRQRWRRYHFFAIIAAEAMILLIALRWQILARCQRRDGAIARFSLALPLPALPALRADAIQAALIGGSEAIFRGCCCHSA